MKAKLGTWGLIYRCLGCGTVYVRSIHWRPSQPDARSLCEDCGAVGLFVELVARPRYEHRWWTAKRLVGYEVKDGPFVRIVRVDPDELDRTREIMS